jgi:tripartite-type tricarboxylate transporter receptor subunit TctC
VAPAGVPKEAINAYAGIMRKVTDTPAWKRYAVDNELVEEYMGPSEMAAFMQRRNDDLAKVLAEIGKPN